MKKIDFKNGFNLFLYSVFYQFWEILDYYLVMKALGLNIPFGSILLFVPMAMLISEIPITVLGLGSREAAILFFFSRFGPPEKLLAAGLLISFVEYILPNLIALLFTKPFLDKMTS